MRFPAAPDTLAGGRPTIVVASCGESPACALTPRERCEYEALPHANRRRDWLAGRLAAKRAIAARWNVAADRIELAATPGAAPRPFATSAARGRRPLSDRLTIAHRDGVAIAAVFPAAASVGVDLDRADEVSPSERRYIMADEESSRLAGIDSTVVWILKEAVWKALGLAQNVPLSSLQLVFDTEASAAAPALKAVRQGVRERPARSLITHIDVGRSLIAAVVEIAAEVS